MNGEQRPTPDADQLAVAFDTYGQDAAVYLYSTGCPAEAALRLASARKIPIELAKALVAEVIARERPEEPGS